LQSYSDYAELRREKPLIRQQLSDIRFWNVALTNQLLGMVAATCVLGATIPRSEHAVMQGVSVAAKETGCTLSTAGIMPIRNLDGSFVSPTELAQGTCKNSLVGNIYRATLHL